MGTLVFVILRLAGLIDTGNDWVMLCFLISLDTIGVPTLLKMVRR